MLTLVLNLLVAFFSIIAVISTIIFAVLAIIAINLFFHIWTKKTLDPKVRTNTMVLLSMLTIWFSWLAYLTSTFTLLSIS